MNAVSPPRRRGAGPLALAALNAVLCACGAGPPAELEDGVFAEWKDGRLGVDELDRLAREARAGGASTSGPGGEEEAIPLRLLAERAVESRLLESEGALARAQLDPAFASDLAARLRDRLASEWLRRRNAPFEVTPAEIEARFALERKRLERPERRSFRHLLAAPAAGETLAAACARAAELAERARRGESFEALAREHSASETRSAGGLVGAVARAQLRREVAEIVFALGSGEVSRPLATPVGCQIFSLVSVEPAGVADLRLLAPQIAREIAGERRRAWLRGLLLAEIRRHGLDPAPLEALAASEPRSGAAERELAPDRVLLELDGEALTGRAVLAERARGEAPVDAAYRLAGAMVLPRSLAADDPAAARRVEAETRRELALERVRQRELEDRIAAVERPVLEAFHTEHASLFAREAQVELTVAHWPVARDRDPLILLQKVQALAPRFADAGAAALAGSGETVQALPREPLRPLLLRSPALSRLGLETLEEGKVVGPWHAGGRLFLVRVDAYLPGRALALAEVEKDVRAAWAVEHRSRLEAELRAERLARHGVRLAGEARFEEFGAALARRLLPAAPAAGGERGVSGQ